MNQIPIELLLVTNSIPRILIVGFSFVGTHLKLLLNTRAVTSTIISYKDIDNIDFAMFDVVINTALNPLHRTERYSVQNDIDVKIAMKIKSYNCKYIMLSSRKVYGNSTSLVTFNEDSPLDPFDFYSENKVITENAVTSILDNRCCILRGSNYFAFEYGRNSFIGFCLNSLKKNNTISYTYNRNIKRDFIHIYTVSDIIYQVIIHGLTGIYNVGSGSGLEIGSIAEHIISGYGSGKFIVSENAPYDQQFILDISKISSSIDTVIKHCNYKEIFINYGKQLEG